MHTVARVHIAHVYSIWLYAHRIYLQCMCVCAHTRLVLPDVDRLRPPRLHRLLDLEATDVQLAPDLAASPLDREGVGCAQVAQQASARSTLE